MKSSETEPKPASADEPFARELRGFGPAGILAILIILFSGNIFIGRILIIPVGGILVLVWAWLSHTPWPEIGYKKPGSRLLLLLAFLLGILLRLLTAIIIMPLSGAVAGNKTFHFLAGNPALLPSAILTMFLVGFGEETVFRGFLFQRMRKWTGRKIVIIILTSLVFGLAHYAQGIFGIEQSLITGLVFGTLFAITKNIWLPILAHAAYDLTAVMIIYFDLEYTVAHLIFK